MVNGIVKVISFKNIQFKIILKPYVVWNVVDSALNFPVKL